MRRAHRLRSSADFQRVRASGRSWAHPLLILYVAPNEAGHPRVGISVSRRIGKAVVRNRVRRRIREAARLALGVGSRESGARDGPSPTPDPRFPTPAYDLLFIARAPSATVDWATLRGAVEALLRRSRLLPPQPRPEGA